MSTLQKKNRETELETAARVSGYEAGLSGLIGKQKRHMILPHLIAKYDSGFVAGRLKRAFDKGYEAYSLGKSATDYPTEFRLHETRLEYTRGHKEARFDATTPAPNAPDQFTGGRADHLNRNGRKEELSQ